MNLTCAKSCLVRTYTHTCEIGSLIFSRTRLFEQGSGNPFLSKKMMNIPRITKCKRTCHSSYPCLVSSGKRTTFRKLFISQSSLRLDCCNQGCQPNSRFSRSFFLGFSRQKTEFLRSVFLLPKNKETEKPTRSFSVGFLLVPCNNNV